MAIVVYNIETTLFLCRHPGTKLNRDVFPNTRMAKAGLTREVNRGAVSREDFAFAERDHFIHHIEKSHEVISAFDGKTKVMQRVNQPWATSVQSEAYWQS